MIRGRSTDFKCLISSSMAWWPLAVIGTFSIIAIRQFVSAPRDRSLPGSLAPYLGLGKPDWPSSPPREPLTQPACLNNHGRRSKRPPDMGNNSPSLRHFQDSRPLSPKRTQISRLVADHASSIGTVGLEGANIEALGLDGGDGPGGGDAAGEGRIVGNLGDEGGAADRGGIRDRSLALGRSEERRV